MATAIAPANSGWLMVVLTNASISLVKSIKDPVLQVQCDGKVLVEVKKMKEAEKDICWVSPSGQVPFFLPMGSFTIDVKVYGAIASEDALVAARTLKTAKLLDEGIHDRRVERKLFNLTEDVVGAVSLCMKVASRQALLSVPTPSPELSKGIPLLKQLRAIATNLLRLKASISNTEAFRCAWTMTVVAYHAYETVFMCFIDRLCPPNARTSSALEAAKKVLIGDLRRRMLDDNAVHELMEQLYNQLHYAARCVARMAEVGRPAYPEQNEHMKTALNALASEVFLAVFLVYGWADVYPNTVYRDFSFAGLRSNRIAWNALSAFDTANYKLVSLRAYMQTIQSPAFPIPTRSSDRHVFRRSLLDFTVDETLRFVHIKHYRRILLCCRGQDADNLLNMIDKDLEECSPTETARRAALRRIMTVLAQAVSKLPKHLRLSRIQQGKQMGGGSYADIYHGIWVPHRGAGLAVVLKRLRRPEPVVGTTGETIKSLLLEMISTQTLRHRHIVEILGFYQPSSESSPVSGVHPLDACMVLPLLANSNIRNYLGKMYGNLEAYPPRVIHISVNAWIGQIALGLKYLHCEQISHGDLRGVNILIDEDKQAVISDFGLSVYVNGRSRGYGSTRNGNEMWLAPEQMEGPDDLQAHRSVRPTFKSDIYTFANLCVEIYRNDDPYPRELSGEEKELIRTGRKTPTRPNNPEGEGSMHHELWRLLNECWSLNPDERPSAQDLVRSFRSPPLNYIPDDHSTVPLRRIRTNVAVASR